MTLTRKSYAITLLVLALLASVTVVIASPVDTEKQTHDKTLRAEKPTSILDLPGQVHGVIASNLDFKSYHAMRRSSKQFRPASYKGIRPEALQEGHNNCKSRWKEIFNVLTKQSNAASAIKIDLKRQHQTSEFFQCFDFVNSICDKNPEIRENPIPVELDISNTLDLSKVITTRSTKNAGCLFALRIISDSSDRVKEFIEIAKLRSQGLDLSGNNMDADSLASILATLADQKDLRHLNLANYEIGKDGAAEIADVLRSENFIPELTELNLGNNNMETKGTVKILQSLANQKYLKVLNLANNRIRLEGSSAIADVFKSDEFAPKLAELDLSQNDMGAECAAVILESLVKQNDLKVLNLAGNKFGFSGSAEIAVSFQSSGFTPKLRELDLSWNDMKNEGTAKVLKSLATQADLKVLSVGNNDIRYSGSETLSVDKVFESSGFTPELVDLDLSGNDLSTWGTAAVLKSLSKRADLKILNLAKSGMSNHYAKFVAEVFESDKFLPRLSKLDLSENMMKDKAAIILKSLSKQKDLKVLNIAQNYLGDEAKSIAKVLESKEFTLQLTELDLSDKILYGLCNEGAAIVVKSLAKQADLKVLKLANNYISEHGAYSLAAVFKSKEFTPKLVELDLSGNYFDEGTAQVLDSLQTQHDLKVLILSKNKIGFAKVGASSVAAVFNSEEFTPKLEVLDLGRNRLHPYDIVVLRKSLEKQTDLRVLNFDDQF